MISSKCYDIMVNPKSLNCLKNLWKISKNLYVLCELTKIDNP